MTIDSEKARTHQGALALFLILFVAIAFKSTDALSLPQFWAEDGPVFFVGQFGHKLPQLFAPYAGYLHAIPRIVAWLATLANPARAPLIYNLSAIVMSAAALTFVVGRLRKFLPLPLMLATFLLLPASGEIFGNLTNVQWFLQLVLPVACLSASPRPRGWRLPIRDMLLLLIALSGPFSLIASIIAAGMWVTSWIDRRFAIKAFEGQLAAWSTRIDRRVIVVLGVGGLIQLVIFLTHPVYIAVGARSPLKLLAITLFDITPIHLFGFDFLTNGCYAVIYLAIIGALVFGRGMAGEYRLTILILLLFSFAGVFSGMAKTPDLASCYDFNISDRYFHALRVVFWWAVFTAIASITTYRKRDISSIVMLCILMISLANLGHMRRGPMQDFQWKAHARELKQPGNHSIPINPPGWSVDVTTP